MVNNDSLGKYDLMAPKFVSGILKCIKFKPHIQRKSGKQNGFKGFWWKCSQT